MRSQNRRSALLLAAGAAANTALSRKARSATPDLRATLNVNGRAFVFAAAQGENLGDFTSEIGGFTQSCIRTTHPELPMTVFFRPDRGSDRVEVVFELGKPLARAPANLGAYTAVIANGAEILATVDVPQHFWFSRWRWQSAPRPVVGRVADMLARHLLPPYEHEEVEEQPAKPITRGLPVAGGPTVKGAALGVGRAPTEKSTRAEGAAYVIMGMAGLEPKMGTTGERIDIGLQTEPQARFICTGDAESLAQLRAQAEAGGTCPWHIRDERSGAPVDLDANPRMSWYDEPRGGGDPYVRRPGSDVNVDSAHVPALAYLPYLLTGDPYHLEDMQFAANWPRGWHPPGSRFAIDQTRAFAWSTRDLACAAKVTPANVPRWLLPKAYFEKLLSAWQRHVTEHYVKDSDPVHAVFRALEEPGATRDEGPTTPAGSYMPPWQSEFAGAVAGWIVMMGYADWKPFFTWQIGSTIARTNGRSGWQRHQATPYRILLRENAQAPFVKSWREAYALQARMWKWDGADPNTITDKDMTYFFYTRGALVMAKHLGVGEAQPCLDWIEAQLQARGAVLPYKWRLA